MAHCPDAGRPNPEIVFLAVRLPGWVLGPEFGHRSCRKRRQASICALDSSQADEHGIVSHRCDLVRIAVGDQELTWQAGANAFFNPRAIRGPNARPALDE